jgi:hypothetical protein
MASAFAILSTTVLARVRRHHRRPGVEVHSVRVISLPPLLDGLCNCADELQVDKTMKLLWHIRHGESTGNVARVAAQTADIGTGLDVHAERYMQSGDYDDTPLTELGKEQARITAKAVVTWVKKPKLIVCSPLTRAIQTAAIVFERELLSGASVLAIRPELREFYPDNRENRGRPRHELRACPLLQDLASWAAVEPGIVPLLYCTHTALMLYHCCTTAVLYAYCAHTVPLLYLYCTHTVLTLYLYCSHTVLILYSYCTRTVLVLYSYCTRTVLILHSHCTYTAVMLYHYCTTAVLHSYCAHTVLTLYSYCTPTVLVLYSYCTRTVLILHTALTLYLYCTHTVLILHAYCTLY